MIVVWRVTEICNLSCGFCAYDRSLKRSRASAEKGQIERFGKVLSDYQKQTDDPVLVSWLGGEPLKWAPLEALTCLYKNQFNLRISTTTNGTTLTIPQIRAHLLENYTELTISIDSLGAAHDELRGLSGLFTQVRAGTRALSSEIFNQRAPLKLRANVVLMRSTASTFGPLCHELAAWGIKEITFNSLGGRDRPEYYPANRLLPQQVDQLAEELPALRAELKETGVSLLGSEVYIERMRASTIDTPISIVDCHPGESFLFIDELGRASPCSFTSAEYGISIDQLASPEALKNLPLTFALARQNRRSVACDDCLSTNVFTKFAPAYGS